MAWVDVQRGMRGHALIDHELVEDVRLIVEVEAAIGCAGHWPHEIPQKLAPAGRGDLLWLRRGTRECLPNGAS